mmetsp:Transcript_11119/g.30739  ORF Transcript_11119/g.30739 Transcript_11119/m.30739 type:complete len:97 (+) Transcript_11119:110-400(+)
MCSVAPASSTPNIAVRIVAPLLHDFHRLPTTTTTRIIFTAIPTGVLLRTLCDGMNRIGEIGYFLASFEAAVTHIQGIDLSNLAQGARSTAESTGIK